MMEAMGVLLKLRFLSVTLLSLLPISTSQPTFVESFCDASKSFTPTSKYHANLNTVFRSLSSNASDPGPSQFFTTVTGKGTPDAVYGLFLCRGDLNTTSCHDCVRAATATDLPTTYCPNRKVAVIWYEECMVRYDDQPLVGKLALRPESTEMAASPVDANSTQLNLLLAKLMDDLITEAAGGDNSGKKFAVKQAKFTSWEDLYVLAECTPDLSGGDCRECLNTVRPSLFVKKEGAEVVSPSCRLRYETYPFYNGARPFPSSPVTNSSENRGAVRKGMKTVPAKRIIAIVVPVVIVSLALLSIGICHINKKAMKKDMVLLDSVGGDLNIVESLQYDLATLQSATNNFSNENKLGQGGFGSVYKGKLSNGQEIAVKRMSKSSSQGVREFKNEVLLVAKLQHRNLVRLLGFCIAGDEKLLVYEFVHNRSLDYFLFDSRRQGVLDWATRYKIIKGVARGMLYLHQESRMKIIHRDLKTSNILLDADMEPKISDFGLARMFGIDQTQGNTSKVVGTYGYMAPEYALHGRFSVKSDVYSFGVLVLEIISSKKNSTFYESSYAEGLVSYAWKKWKEGMLLEFVDATIRDSCSSNEAMRCTHIGLLCVQESLYERPTMATVVQKLETHDLILPAPQPPAFYINTQNECDQWTTSQSAPSSLNEASFSEMEPR